MQNNHLVVWGVMYINNIMFNMSKAWTACTSFFSHLKFPFQFCNKFYFEPVQCRYNSIAPNAIMDVTVIYLRPKVFHSVKFRDETKIGLPRFALVILEEPKSPPEKSKKSYCPLSTYLTQLCSDPQHFLFSE